MAKTKTGDQLQLLEDERQLPEPETRLVDLVLVREDELIGRTLEKAFTDSVRRQGFLQPPLLVALEDGRYQVAAGRKRILTARHLGLSHMEVKVYPVGTDPYLIALSENEHRSSNLASDLRAIEALAENRRDLAQPELVKFLCATTGKTKPVVERLLYLVDVLPDFFRQKLEASKVALSVAEAVAKARPEEQAQAKAWFEETGKLTMAEFKVIRDAAAQGRREELARLQPSLFDMAVPSQARISVESGQGGWRHAAQLHLSQLERAVPEQFSGAIVALREELGLTS